MPSLTLAAYQDAERAVALEEGRRGFAVHLVITCLVVLGLVVLNITIADEFAWSIFPAIGMSIGLFAHWYFGVARADDVVRRHQDEIEHRAAA